MAVALGVGLLVAGGITAFDLIGGRGVVVIGTVVLAPFVVSLFAGSRETALVAVVAGVLAVVSAAWNHNFDSGAYWLRCAVVAVGGVVAVLAARGRERAVTDQRRFALLTALAGVADGQLTLEQTAARVCALAVPGLADVCLLDVAMGGRWRRLAVGVAGSNAAEYEAQLRTREPSHGEAAGAMTGGRTGSRDAELLTSRDELLAAVGGEEGARLLALIGVNAGVVVALRARGLQIGRLTLLASDARGAYSEDETRFVDVFAGRVALALDNAGLYRERQSIEAQLTAALGNLADAVTIQDRHGSLIYANEAAAELLGYASPADLLATPPAHIVERFESFHEDGAPVRVDQLPGRRVLEGETPLPMTVRSVHKETGEQRWRTVKSSAVRDSDGQVSMVVNVVADVTAVKRAEFAQRLLADAGEAFASSLDIQDTLQHVADLCVPELADWCSVSLPTAHNELQTVAVAHTDPDKVALARRIGESYVVSLDEPGAAARVFRDGVTECINGISEEMLVAAAQDAEHLHALRALGMHAALVLPMKSSRGTAGVLTLVSAESRRRFRDEDIPLPRELARRAGVAMENSRLYSERSAIARTLQASLMPDELPELTGWRAASLYQPAGDENQVGGDFYAAIPLKDEWVLAMGDVTGRGAPAAALTAFMRHTLRAAATLTGSASLALEKLNEDLCARDELSLCTAACVVVPQQDADAPIDILCAGHPLPVLIRDGRATEIGQPGPLLGAYTDAHWPSTRLEARPGDIVFVYSDGLTDTVGADERFGTMRLLQTLARATSAGDAIARVKHALSAFEAGEQADDLAILAIERIPSTIRHPDVTPPPSLPRLTARRY